MDHRHRIPRWRPRNPCAVGRGSAAYRRNRPARGLRYQSPSGVRARGGRRSLLDAGRRYLGARQETLGGSRGRHNYQGRNRNAAPTGVVRPRDHPDLQRPGGRSDLLPRRAADAFGSREGRDQAAGPGGHSAHRLAPSLRERAEKPPGAGRLAHVHQLPFVLARRQDPGDGRGRAAERQGDLRHRRRKPAHDHPRRGHNHLERLPQQAARAAIPSGFFRRSRPTGVTPSPPSTRKSTSPISRTIASSRCSIPRAASWPSTTAPPAR